MNWAELERDWNRVGPLVKTHWPKLTDEAVQRAGGSRDRLAAALQATYGYDVEEAERAICSFEKEVRFPGAVK